MWALCKLVLCKLVYILHIRDKGPLSLMCNIYTNLHSTMGFHIVQIYFVFNFFSIKFLLTYTDIHQIIYSLHTENKFESILKMSSSSKRQLPLIKYFDTIKYNRLRNMNIINLLQYSMFQCIQVLNLIWNYVLVRRLYSQKWVPFNLFFIVSIFAIHTSHHI